MLVCFPFTEDLTASSVLSPPDNKDFLTFFSFAVQLLKYVLVEMCCGITLVVGLFFYCIDKHLFNVYFILSNHFIVFLFFHLLLLSVLQYVDWDKIGTRFTVLLFCNVNNDVICVLMYCNMYFVVFLLRHKPTWQFNRILRRAGLPHTFTYIVYWCFLEFIKFKDFKFINSDYKHLNILQSFFRPFHNQQNVNL